MAPVISAISPDHGPAAGGTPVTITGGGFTGVTSVKFGSVPVASFMLVSDSRITTTAPAGTGAAAVTVTSPLGTSNSVTYTYGTAPVISGLNPASGTAGSPVTISGSGFTGASSVHFGSASVTSFTVVDDTRIQTAAPAGSGAVPVTVTTPVGTSNAVTYTYGTGPVITALNPASGTNSGGTLVTISGTGFTGTTAVRFGSSPALFLVVGDSQVTATAPSGTGVVPVTVTTAAGTSNALTYTYVNAPLITAVDPDQGPTDGGNTVTITGTGLSGATGVLFGTHAAAVTADTSTQITATAPAGAAQSVSVTVTTAAGTSNPLPYFYVAAPSITGIYPTMGPTGGADTVTVFGSGLALTSAVHFGSAAVTGLTVDSDSQLTATAPPGTGTVLVTATTPGGTSTVGLGNAYYCYVPPPVVTSLSPAQGSASGGDSVLIRGSGLTYTDAVLFGTTQASFAAVSDTMVVATAPHGAAGPATVTVHSPGGTSNGAAFQYQP